ncbi:MAG: hypothetical protein M3N57_01845 [Actinomycetota bacterium]|nr:hypothetical protein [Actinomycetota bacterium]
MARFKETASQLVQAPLRLAQQAAVGPLREEISPLREEITDLRRELRQIRDEIDEIHDDTQHIRSQQATERAEDVAS